GEKGTIYDNEYQLYHGGEVHRNAVDNGKFDGFLLYPQSTNTTGFFATWQYAAIKEVIENYLIPQVKVDVNRVIIDGLSGGGTSTWQFSIAYPGLVAAALPISAVSNSFTDNIQSLKWTPMWLFQGGLDQNPAPGTALNVSNAYKNAGANFKYTLYPTQGHGCWYAAWAEPDYFPFMTRAHKANPWPLTGRTEFCPGDPISVTMGVSAGFSGYEWRRNGTVIAGATSNQYVATQAGTYDVRIRRGTTWSVFSPTPVNVTIKAPTVTPPITLAPQNSNVIPALDTTTAATLTVPVGYNTYAWVKDGSATVLGTSNTFRATTPGNYRVKVTELYGCSSDFSAPYTVVAANGPNKPSPATNVKATTASKTSLKIDWVDNPAPTYNETGYEVYQAEQAGGPYKFVALTAANANTYTATGLASNKTYFYVLRAVNASGASTTSNESSATTDRDANPPTTPANLAITAQTKTSVSLKWDASTDDVAVTGYEVFVNGVMNYTTTSTTFTVPNLTYQQAYQFKVRAIDAAGNKSQFSNQAAARTAQKGLDYRYFIFSGTWNSFPNLNTLTPFKTGNVPNVTLGGRSRDDGFAFIWEGYIRITTAGNYQFRTNSDDGSMLYLGARNSQTPAYNFGGPVTVNNDGLHGSQDRTSAVLSLQPGVYPIAILYYDQSGDHIMNVRWSTPASAGAFVAIPDAQFTEIDPAGDKPNAPSNLVPTALSHKSIRINWTDNSTNETGFEVYRSAVRQSGYLLVGTTAANATSYTDTGLVAGTRYYYKVRSISANGESNFYTDPNPIDYSYYEALNLSVVPNFASLTPVKTGKQASFSLGVQNRGDNFALKQNSFISVPVSGTYTFYTSSDDGSKLWINGTADAQIIVNNDGLHGTQERSGTYYMIAGYIYPIQVGFFEAGGGEVLEVRYSGPGVDKQLIPNSVLGDPSVNVQTLGAPTAPAAPTALLANGTSGTSIGLTWTDNAANETGYEVYRSPNDANNFTLLASIAANANSYADTALNPGAMFYYRVRATGDGVFSAYSNSDSAITLNSKPVVKRIVNQTMRFDGTLSLDVLATDADLDNLTITFLNLPPFGAFTPTGNGTGTLTFTPGSNAAIGTYSNVSVIAKDTRGAADTSVFNLVVNDNYKPVIVPVSNISVNENTSSTVTLIANDQNVVGGVTWSFAGLPAFATTVTSGDTARIALAPGFTDNGAYSVIAKADDGNGGVDSVTFVITVNDVSPSKTVFVNFTGGTYVAPSPWNNTNKKPVTNDNFPNLIDGTGAASSIGFSLGAGWTDINNLGSNTGNNSGVYPDNVLRSSWYTSTSATIRVYGLDPATKYKLSFLGSRANPVSGVGVVANYTAGGQTVTQDAANNATNVATISNLTPLPDGSITVTVAKAAGSSFAYINSLVIEGVYGEGTVPAKPRALAGVVENGRAKLSWTDAAFNETSYEVFRADTLAGNYTLLYTGAANLTQYTDSTVTGNKSFFYTVRAVNASGASAFSDTVTVTTPNVAPKLAAISAVIMKTGTTTTVPVTATDDAGDIITLTVTGLPTFATFTNTGNGTGTINIAPGTTKGSFKDIKVTAKDQAGLTSERLFDITVTDANLTTAFINFNQTDPAPFPWNNFNAAPNAGVVLSNIVDENNAATTYSVTLLDKWVGHQALGVVTGNNSGVYPDVVMKTFYYENTANTRRIKVSGLAANKRYNLKFFASRQTYTTALGTRYTIGTQSVDLDANGNTTNTVQINGLQADAAGEITISMARITPSVAAYIGAMEIQSYDYDGTPLAPTALTAVGMGKDRISLSWTSPEAGITAYEVWRSTTATGTYTKFADVAATPTTYLNTGLAAGTSFYYKVRAVKDGVFSPYSNFAGASTYGYTVNLNFNDGTAATGPSQGGNWNNTNALVSPGFTVPNMINDQGQATGVNFQMVTNFSGYNYLGTTTGNNSGVYPDNVMKSFYYANFADTVRFRLTGLNLSSTYTVVFFGSRINPSVGVVGAYRIGNQVVTLNAANNTANTVQINNVKPEADGTINIMFYGTQQGGFGYLNAMTVHGMAGTVEDPSVLKTNTVHDPIMTTIVPESELSVADSQLGLSDKAKIDVYPNPFIDEVMVRINLKKDAAKLAVLVYDLNGRIVTRKDFENLKKGIWQQRIQLGSNTSNRGVYFLRVVTDSQQVETIKLLKR
ncbi:MAG: fibronectin type III domain-containing protein, partial [Flavitalea sp.]